jgi:hypothetical protein
MVPVVADAHLVSQVKDYRFGGIIQSPNAVFFDARFGDLELEKVHLGVATAAQELRCVAHDLEFLLEEVGTERALVFVAVDFLLVIAGERHEIVGVKRRSDVAIYVLQNPPNAQRFRILTTRDRCAAALQRVAGIAAHEVRRPIQVDDFARVVAARIFIAFRV